MTRRGEGEMGEVLIITIIWRLIRLLDSTSCKKLLHIELRNQAILVSSLILNR